MKLVYQAVLARQRGDVEVVIEFSRAAFTEEGAAADLVANLFSMPGDRLLKPTQTHSPDLPSNASL